MIEYEKHCIYKKITEMKDAQGQQNMRKEIPVTRSSMPSLDEYIEEIRGLWDTHWLTNMGAKHRELEDKLKAYLGVKGLQLFANGHMALEMLLQVMGLKGEVITTPFTFASTTHAIVRNGLTPVFGDIKEDDYTLDPDKIEALITDRTSAILPVHVYGNVCDDESLREIADRHGLKVIYDAAHCFGVRYKGRGVGSLGDASIFSFHATKVFNTIEGGAVCFNDEALEKELYFVKNFGIVDELHVHTVGGNAKMNEFAAAMGLCNLRHVDEEIAKRARVYEHYNERLSGLKGIKLPVRQTDVTANYAYYPIVIDPEEFGSDRDTVYESLRGEGIHARRYFYPITSAFECYKGRFDVNETPIALKISERVLTLPMYSELDLADADRVCDCIASLCSCPRCNSK